MSRPSAGPWATTSTSRPCPRRGRPSPHAPSPSRNEATHMIRTEMKDDRGEIVKLTPNDADYWTGPYVYQPYPKMLFRITTPGQQEPEHLIVQSESEHTRAGSAWKETPDEARDHFNKLES